MTLKIQTHSGIKWTSFSTIVVTAVQILQLSILTRFLLPADFGVMAIVMVIIGFSQAFLDMGISNAIIQKQDITDEQLSSLYWLNVISGAILFIVVCAISPLMALFYEKSELTVLVVLVAITFLIQPFGQQFMVLWQKEMRFAEICKIDISSKLMSLFVSVGCAYCGYGVYSLVFGTLAAVSLQTILFLLLGLKEHRPHLVFRWCEVREFVSFGAYQVGERTINYFNAQIDVIVIGKLLGTGDLGVYNVAKQLIMRPAQLVNPIITKVTFPAMAKMQGDPEALKKIYLKTTNYLSSINFPIYAIMIIVAPEIVLLLFGAKWMEAVPIVQVLCIYGALRSTGNPVGSLILARGRANLGFYWNLALLFYIPVGIAIVSHLGLLAISWMLVVMSLTLILPSWYYLVKPLSGARLPEYLIQILTPLSISVVAGLCGALLSSYITQQVSHVSIALVVPLVLYMTLSLYFNRTWVNAMADLLLKKPGNI